MCKFNPKNNSRFIDPCMKELVENLNWVFQKIVDCVGYDKHKCYHIGDEPDWKIVACCCGHGKYPMTIIVKDSVGMLLELFSGEYLKQGAKRFYKKDKQGYYYIPEVMKNV